MTSKKNKKKLSSAQLEIFGSCKPTLKVDEERTLIEGNLRAKSLRMEPSSAYATATAL